MRDTILDVLSPIIGLPIWSFEEKVSGFQLQIGKHHSGVSKDGESHVEWGDYSLMVSSSWRIIAEGQIYTGAWDINEAEDENIDEFDPDLHLSV